jgi:hypothetical protein
MSLEAWQAALRRQYGREQRFRLENVGEHPILSEFTVTNPQSRRAYRVAIRGREPGRAGSPAGAGDGAEARPLLERERDERTGQTYLRLRMPEPEVLDRVAGALQTLLERLRV